MKIKETVRKDGLRIISCYVPHRRTIDVEILSRVGSAYNPPEKQGLFHCFEHMAFKGTKKRNLKELQDFNGKYLMGSNAGTNTLSTTYEVHVLDRKLVYACEYLCDIYLNSIFPTVELEKEKGPILLEIARKKDNDSAVTRQALMEHLYSENPIRVDGVGTIEGIQNIKRSDLVEQRNKWHIPSNTVAIAVGNIKHEQFVKEISKRIPHNSKKVELNTWSDEYAQLPSEKEVVIDRPGKQKQIIAIGCKLPKNLDEKTDEIFGLYSKMICSKQDSLLWNEIREKRGLAYILDGGFYYAYGLGKTFRVYAEIDPAKEEVFKKVLWKNLLNPKFSKKEFEDYKRKIEDSFEIKRDENSGDFEDMIWRKIVEGEPVRNIIKEEEERLKIIKSITLKDLYRVSKKFIRKERFVTVILRPGKSA